MQTTKRSFKAGDLINIALGIWIAISPWVLGADGSHATEYNNLIVGLLIAAVSLAGALVNGAFTSLVVPLCTWLFTATFVLGFSTWPMVGSNVTLSFVIMAVAAISDGLRQTPTANAGL